MFTTLSVCMYVCVYKYVCMNVCMYVCVAQTTQHLSCNCIQSACNGSFRVSFDGEMSARILASDTGQYVYMYVCMYCISSPAVASMYLCLYVCLYVCMFECVYSSFSLLCCMYVYVVVCTRYFSFLSEG